MQSHPSFTRVVEQLVLKTLLALIIFHVSSAFIAPFLPESYSAMDKWSIAMIPLIVIAIIWYVRGLYRTESGKYSAYLLMRFLGYEESFSVTRLATPALILGGLATLISPDVLSAATIAFAVLVHLSSKHQKITEEQPAAARPSTARS